MPKPRQGLEVKKHQSIRLEPEAKIRIIKKFGSVQAFVDLMIQKEVPPPDKKETPEKE